MSLCNFYSAVLTKPAREIRAGRKIASWNFWHFSCSGFIRCFGSDVYHAIVLTGAASPLRVGGCRLNA